MGNGEPANDADVAREHSLSPGATSPRPCCRRRSSSFFSGRCSRCSWAACSAASARRSRARPSSPSWPWSLPLKTIDASRLLASGLPTPCQIPMVVQLAHYSPQANSAAQQKKLLASRKPPVRAVLTGGLANPHLMGPVDSDSQAVGQLRLILADAKTAQGEPPELPVTATGASTGSMVKDRALTGQIGQMLLFFLTLLLSGMVMSQLIEEKSNKIIEVIAAAVPIDCAVHRQVVRDAGRLGCGDHRLDQRRSACSSS